MPAYARTSEQAEVLAHHCLHYTRSAGAQALELHISRYDRHLNDAARRRDSARADLARSMLVAYIASRTGLSVDDVAADLSAFLTTTPAC